MRTPAPEPAGGGGRGSFGSVKVTSLKSKEESLQRAQMVASSTSPSYCPARTGLSFFRLAAAAGWGEGRKREVEKIGSEMQREQGDSSEAQAGAAAINPLGGQVGREQGQGRKRERQTQLAREEGVWGRADLHLSFGSVGGAGDGELVEHAGVPLHLVDDKHLREREGSVRTPGSLPRRHRGARLRLPLGQPPAQTK